MSSPWNNRSALGVEDFDRADKLLKGAKGKRLSYRLAMLFNRSQIRKSSWSPRLQIKP
jgi:hypothetical protein